MEVNSLHACNPPLLCRSVHGAGQQYRRFCRRRITNPDAPPSEHDVMDAAQPEEVLLDQDLMAGGCWWLQRAVAAANAPAGPAAAVGVRILHAAAWAHCCP